MMHTPYEKLYENLLPKFISFKIPMMDVDEVKDYLHDYLIPAISRFHVCRKDLNDRNDILQRFNVELNSVEIEILSNYMLLEYIDSTYVRTPTLLQVNLPSTDFHAFSPGNFLGELMAMHKTYKAENETLISRYAWMGEKTNKTLSGGTGYKKSKMFYGDY